LTSVFKRDDHALRKAPIDPKNKEKEMDPRYVTPGSYEECFPGVYETARYNREDKEGAVAMSSSSEDEEEEEEEDDEGNARQKVFRKILESQPKTTFQLMEHSYVEGARTRKRKSHDKDKDKDKEKKVGPDGKKIKTKDKSESQKLNEELTKINNILKKKDTGFDIIDKKGGGSSSDKAPARSSEIQTSGASIERMKQLQARIVKQKVAGSQTPSRVTKH